MDVPVVIVHGLGGASSSDYAAWAQTGLDQTCWTASL